MAATIELVDPAVFGRAFLEIFRGETEPTTWHPERVLAEGQCTLWLAFVSEHAVAGLLATEQRREDGVSYGALENLIVERARRRRGIGRRLMEEAEDHFRARKVGGLQLRGAGNNVAQGLYVSLGFREVARYVRVRHGVEEPRVRMWKDLWAQRGGRRGASGASG
jgi:ribosomal protein S18 acetylase RimI-like enzyme